MDGEHRPLEDVGGIVPGSISNEANQIFQEGLRLPAIKLISEGSPNQAVMEIMKANSRLPDFLRGEMWAGVAAARVGERRILDLIAKYGCETFVLAVQTFMDHARAGRLALQRLPHGRFAIAEEQDSGAVYHAVVEMTDDALVVDLRENLDQDPGPNNLSRDGAMIAAQMAFMNITGAHASANAGHFRPLKLLTRSGSVFDAAPPAAFGTYYEVGIRLYDVLLRCLAPHLGDRIPAGNFGSICGTFIGGPHPDTGRHFTIVEPQIGGWGGSALRDGNSAIFSGFHGETFNCSAEVAEARYGLYVEQLALGEERGGEGKHRGGK